MKRKFILSHRFFRILLFISIIIFLQSLTSFCEAEREDVLDTQQRLSEELFKDKIGFNLSPEAINKLKENNFVVVPGDKDNFNQVYQECKESNIPIFVTTDSIFHTTHLFFNYIMRIIEIEYLYDAANKMVSHLLESSIEQYHGAVNPEVKEAARLNIGVFAVAKKQFNPDLSVEYQLHDLVEKECQNIEAQKGLAFRELLSYVENPSLYDTPYAYEDYSQYKVRGHYTRNEKFEQYFKAMMWLGRIDFKLRPADTKDAILHGRQMTLQALLMADALISDEEAFNLWEKIYKVTTYFVGQSDDLNVYDYQYLIQEIFGQDYQIENFADNKKIDQFIEKGMTMREPKILSGAADTEAGEFASTTKGFRLMGQRFIPDSYILQGMVYQVKEGKQILLYTGNQDPFTMEIIPNVGPARAFPRGLDIAAVFGSQRAMQILREEGDTEYTYYDEQLNLLTKEFSDLDEEEWQQNLYWSWLYSFLPFFENNEHKFPWLFINQKAWKDKMLQTMLGSWTELRHDTILYAKQSYTMFTRSLSPEPTLTRGFVEPYPKIFQRLKILSKGLNVTLENYDIDLSVKVKLENFIHLLGQLETISEKEIQGRELIEEEYKTIWNIGELLSSVIRFPKELMEKISSQSDEQSAIVADVHTDINTEQVLEEAIGLPSNLFVMINKGNGGKIFCGPVFSYYEFKHPMDDRLTDEQWQLKIKENQLPPLPKWVDSFIVNS